MHHIIPIPALNDNYIWTIVHPRFSRAIVIDPGEATPVLKYLAAEKLQLNAILITHRHWDHTNGIDELLTAFPNTPVYAGHNEQVKQTTHAVHEGEQIIFPNMECAFEVLEIPGHTIGHVAFVGLGGVFSGDTLFTCGCGRVFEGSMEQMYHSLQKFTVLPEETLVYCGHEYTLKNCQFASTIEPNNRELIERLEKTKTLCQSNIPTVPATLKLELATNPFLRVTHSSVHHAVSEKIGKTLHNPVEVFAALRALKDHY